MTQNPTPSTPAPIAPPASQPQQGTNTPAPQTQPTNPKARPHLGPMGSGNPLNQDPVFKLFNDYGKPVTLTIDEALIRLQYKNSFYATVASGIARRAVNEAVCPTLAVVVNPETNLGVELIYNPDYFVNITSLTHFEFVLEHELVHLILQHLQRFWEHRLSKTEHGKQIFNIAADYATNDLIVRHFDKDEQHLRTLYLFSQQYTNKQLKEAESLEYYLKNLFDKTSEEEIQQMMQKMVNNHHWDKKLNGDGELEDVGDNDIKKAKTQNDINFTDFIQKQAEKHERKHGKLPGYVRELIDELIPVENKPNWDDLLKSELMNGAPVTPERCVMRFSRRLYGVPQAAKFPGKKTVRGYKIAFIQDTSGSICTDDLKAAAAIVADLKDHKHAIELFYVQADTQVRFHKIIKDISDFEWKAHGRGGTDFIQPLEWVGKHLEPDIVVYFTDGYGSAPFAEPKFKVVWVLPSGCRAPSSWGTSVTVNYGRRYY